MDPESISALSDAGQDLSLIGLFLSADIIVQGVMLALLLASVWSWALMFEKSATMRRLNHKAKKFEESFWSGGSLDDLYERVSRRPGDPMTATFVAGMREWRLAAERMGGKPGHLATGLAARVDRVMNATIQREMGQAERGMIVLASVGSASPFVGLFGTVWGIINAFTAIAETQNTNIAVVAPGIAEALFTTALGLIAAIPATIAYNKFSVDLGRYAERLESFGAEFSALLSRHAEQGGEG